MAQPDFLRGRRHSSPRPASGSVPNFVDTGSILANDFQLFGTEAALVYGPLSLQAEWMASNVDSTAAGRFVL